MTSPVRLEIFSKLDNAKCWQRQACRHIAPPIPDNNLALLTEIKYVHPLPSNSSLSIHPIEIFTLAHKGAFTRHLLKWGVGGSPVFPAGST